MAVCKARLEQEVMQTETIKKMTYEEWEEEFYSRKWNKLMKFLKSLLIRMFGALFMIATILLTIYVDGEFAIACVFTIPLGLFLTFAKSETLLYGDVIKW